MSNYPLLLSGDVDFMVKGIFKYNCFGHEVWITTTHVCTLIVMLLLIIFGACAGRAVRNADIDKAPGTFLNIVELLIDFLDGVINSTMGKNAAKFVNYIFTLFLFIFLSNISGLLGLRPPTADYGVTFPLGIITFGLITFNKFKHQKVSGVIKGLSHFTVPASFCQRSFWNRYDGTLLRTPSHLRKDRNPRGASYILRSVFRRDTDICILYADHDLCKRCHRNGLT